METSQIPHRTADLWSGLISGFDERKAPRQRNCPDKPAGTSAAGLAETQIFYPQLDDRTAQMMEIFTLQSFNDASYYHRMRLLLVYWVIHNIIKGSLKRYLDVIICLIVLPFLVPVLLITALAVKLDSPGPIIFRQKRVGKWGKPFYCYKFRSMYVDAEARKAELMHLNEADAIVFKIAKDPRVTRVGRIIRKLSIDELPQIFNVIKGDMSLVGPRPPVPYEVANYEYEYLRRLHAIPGITGLQQVSGRSTLNFNRWIELDLQYIQEQSLAKDIIILLKTIPAVITGKGAY
jgi:exopolysaccharide biosynthesis polyprenyl glycosylphosphotransferase